MVLSNETGYLWTPSTLLGTMVHVVSYLREVLSDIWPIGRNRSVNGRGDVEQTDGRTDGGMDGQIQIIV